ncbi:hypothetical protein [Streptomyces sp. NPDC013457]|uniref:hypothetical protein n=1 Tax=Streptomyces sp. NPDC013457 TaxID=3364866 RepID=UPI003702DC31
MTGTTHRRYSTSWSRSRRSTDAEHVTQRPAHLVVGVDGSESSRAAPAWAFAEADFRRGSLRAVAVREPSSTACCTAHTAR